jgi:hypothetical protein
VFYNSIDNWHNIRSREGGEVEERQIWEGEHRWGRKGASGGRAQGREEWRGRSKKESNGVEGGEAVGDRVREEEGEGDYNVGFLRRVAAGQMGRLAQLMFAKCWNQPKAMVFSKKITLNALD